MKKVLVVLFVVQVLCSCGQSPNKVENILFDCLRESYGEAGVDLNRELLELESHLISVGSLESSKGQAYFDYYKQVVVLNDFPGVVDYYKIEAISRLKPNEYYATECLETISALDSIEIRNSKYYQMNLEIQKVTTKGDIEPSTIAEAILSVLSAKDFETSFYRAIALLTITHTSKPLDVSNDIDYSDYIGFDLELTAKDDILLYKSIVNTSELKKKLKIFIIEHESQHVIHFETHKETSYNFYVKIYDDILEIYKTIKREKSRELFEKEFDDLLESEKGIIENKYKKNVLNVLD